MLIECEIILIMYISGYQVYGKLNSPIFASVDLRT
jgi:hypothetical protein